jgi:hypothetical protein
MSVWEETLKIKKKAIICWSCRNIKILKPKLGYRKL